MSKITSVVKYGSDNALQAWTFNSKEERVLERQLQTIQLEEDYAIKLLDLSAREIKISNRRLKVRVSKIRSYLKPEEIKELRSLEYEGKLKPEYNQVKSNTATRIAAAARRLKINTYSRAKSATLPDTKSAFPPSRLPSGVSVRRPNSVAGAFIDDPQLPMPRQKGESNEEITRPTLPRRPATSHGFTRDMSPESVRKARCKSIRGASKSAQPRAKFSYSSHNATDRAAPPVRVPTGRRFSNFSDDSMENNFNNKSIMEDQRHGLLEQELVKTVKLKEQQKVFLDEIEKWIRENRSFISYDTYDSIEQPVAAWQSRIKTEVVQSSRSSWKDPHDMSTEEVWKDLKKCRYLRISDDLVDLSGVVTLASEQMKLLHSMNRIIPEKRSLLQ